MSDKPDPPKRRRRDSVATMLVSVAMVVLAAQLAWLVFAFEISNAEPAELRMGPVAWYWKYILFTQEHFRLFIYAPLAAALGLLGLSTVARRQERSRS